MTQKELKIEILRYEIFSSWWNGWIGFNWAQDLTARYFAWKVVRKFNIYLKAIERDSK